MTSRERMLIAMTGGQPDVVPVAPDISNMIPCRMLGKPFWEVYLYQDPPLWEAYIHAAKHFGFDGWQPAVPVELDHEREAREQGPQWTQAIVQRTAERIYTRNWAIIDGKRRWTDHCTVYYIADPPTWGVPLKRARLPEEDPETWEDVAPRQCHRGTEALQRAKELMGEDGVVGAVVGTPMLGMSAEAVYEWADNREAVIKRCEAQGEAYIRRAREIVKLDVDFVLTGSSGMMINNPEPIFRMLGLPTLKEVTRICKEAGVPSQIHCCGPEAALVRICAEETDLSSINPLEIPPMGDCDLALLKREYGSAISLMGNLHTTEVMLRGTPQVVIDAAKRAIDDAASRGGFILSTGDQCGRDTPDENLMAMIELARTYGRY
ncbi:MAG: uroporphyrinogen decarboxylase family protein [Armatimonadota bacterium]